MSVLIKHMAMPKGCIYANDKDQTEYCPLLNHDDVPFCQYIETEPEIAIGIDERPVYCPLFDVPESCQDTVSRAAAIDALYKMLHDCFWADDEELDAVITTLNDLPSAQQERTGKWIEYDNSHCECPFCHEEWSYFDNEVEHFNYCPNCGARMKN